MLIFFLPLVLTAGLTGTLFFAATATKPPTQPPSTPHSTELLDGMIQRPTLKLMGLLAFEKGTIRQLPWSTLEIFNLIYLHHYLVNAIANSTVAMADLWRSVQYQWLWHRRRKADRHSHCHTKQWYFNLAYLNNLCIWKLNETTTHDKCPCCHGLMLVGCRYGLMAWYKDLLPKPWAC